MSRSRASTPRCERCHLRPDLCLCATVVRQPNQTRVTVVMHVSETARTSNTTHLLTLSLNHVRIAKVGERDAPFVGLGPAAPGVERFLLFPDANARLLPDAVRHLAPSQVELVIPDGTWSQARRLTQRAAEIRSLPRVALPQVPPSVYTLRRNQKAGGVCTAEAVALAIGLIEGAHLARPVLDLVAAFSHRALVARASPRLSLSR